MCQVIKNEVNNLLMQNFGFIWLTLGRLILVTYSHQFYIFCCPSAPVETVSKAEVASCCPLSYNPLLLQRTPTDMVPNCGGKEIFHSLIC